MPVRKVPGDLEIEVTVVDKEVVWPTHQHIREANRAQQQRKQQNAEANSGTMIRWRVGCCVQVNVRKRGVAQRECNVC